MSGGCTIILNTMWSPSFGFTFLSGPPDEVTNLNIPCEMITPTSFVVQWSEPSSDAVCGPVHYIVTVSTEEE